jgi:signal transduction histidine kinase
MVVGIIVGISGPAGLQMWGALASLAAIVVVHFAMGRAALVARRASGLTRWTAALLIASSIVAAWCAPAAAIVQAFVYPLLWRLSSTSRSAVARSAALAFGIATATGFATGAWGSAILAGVLVLAFTIALGLWITGIQKYGLERDRLIGELRAAQDEVSALERQSGITEERARVAREIHDTIAQSLTGLVMTAQRAASKAARSPESVGPELSLIENLAQEALAEARTLVASYTPVTVTGGLPATLTAIAERFSAETGVAVAVSGEAPAVDREGEVVLLRCAQEALANVRKHARASNVRIRLDEAGVTVSDDGIGMDEAAGGGYGLSGMAERVRLVGGTVEVGRTDPTGTTVRVVLPRRTNAEDLS